MIYDYSTNWNVHLYVRCKGQLFATLAVIHVAKGEKLQLYQLEHFLQCVCVWGGGGGGGWEGLWGGGARSRGICNASQPRSRLQLHVQDTKIKVNYSRTLMAQTPLGLRRG